MRFEKTFEIPASSVKRSIDHWSNANLLQLSDDESNEIYIKYIVDKFNNENISKRVQEFLEEALGNNYNIRLGASICNFISETINNAYDSFANFDLSADKPLILKIVIKNDKGNVTIKISDNGPGFSNQPKSNYFTRNEIQPDTKNKSIGGAKKGLFCLEQSLLKMHGSLFFKNRKETGASVYLQIPKPKKDKSKCLIS